MEAVARHRRLIGVRDICAYSPSCSADDHLSCWARRGARLRPFDRDTALREYHARLAEKEARRRVAARAIPAAVRREVLAVGSCAYCVDGAAEVVDHIMPVARGGNRNRRNLAPACERCNDEKGDDTLEEWRAWRERHGYSWPVDRAADLAAMVATVS